MVGFLIVTHTAIAEEMVEAVRQIIKEKPHLEFINLDSDRPAAESQQQIREALLRLGQKNGVIILTDLLGATPSNICRDFCVPQKIEMITGCNLPMVLKAATMSFKEDVTTVTQFLKNYGCENIRTYP